MYVAFVLLNSKAVITKAKTPPHRDSAPAEKPLVIKTKAAFSITSNAAEGRFMLRIAAIITMFASPTLIPAGKAADKMLSIRFSAAVAAKSIPITATYLAAETFSGFNLIISVPHLIRSVPCFRLLLLPCWARRRLPRRFGRLTLYAYRCGRRNCFR